MVFLSYSYYFSIRGALTAMAMMFFSTGLLSGYILATYLDYYLIPCIIVVLPIIYLAGNLFLPETPQCLLKHGREKEAELSFNFYKNIDSQPKVSQGRSQESFTTQSSVAINEFKELKAVIELGGLSVPVTLRDFGRLKHKCESSFFHILHCSTIFLFFTSQ